MTTVFVLTSKRHACSENTNGSYHSLITGLKLNDVRIKTTGSCEMLDSDDETVVEEDIVSVGKDENTNLIILMFVNIPETKTSDDFPQEPYLSKAIEIDRWDKTIFIDYYEITWRNVFDWKEPSYHQWLLEKCRFYFKRELKDWHQKGHKNMLPYPLSYFPPRNLSFPVKRFDIFCSFPQKITSARRKVIELCKELQGHYNVIIKDDCTKEEYIDLIRSSWITLDAAGAGDINHRFLEIISNRSLCCREMYSVVFYKDYTQDMIVEYATVKELGRELKRLLGNRMGLLEMEGRAYEHYQKYHTADKVVGYLLETSL